MDKQQNEAIIEGLLSLYCRFVIRTFDKETQSKLLALIPYKSKKNIAEIERIFEGSDDVLYFCRETNMIEPIKKDIEFNYLDLEVRVKIYVENCFVYLSYYTDYSEAKCKFPLIRLPNMLYNYANLEKGYTV